MKKVLIVVIFIVAILLRGVEVYNGNYIFNFDAGRDLLVARSIVEQHKLTLIGAEIGSGSAGINGIFQGPGYYYLLAVAYWLYHGDPYGALLMMFVFGMATLVAVYWTVKKIFDEDTAIVALFLTAVSPLIASQSRFIWAPHPASLFVVLFLFVVYLVPKKPRLYAPLAIFLAGMTYHFEFAMTIPMILAFLIAMPLIYKIRDLRTYLYSFASLFVVFSPLLLFEMRHGFMAFHSILSYSTPKGPVGKDVWFLRITDHLGPYIANAKNSFPTEKGLIPDWIFSILAGALILVLALRRNKYFRFLLLLLGTSYVSFLLLNNIIWDYYLIHAHFVFIYALAYVFVLCLKKVRKRNWAKIGIAVLAVLFLSMIVSSVNRIITNIRYDVNDFGGVEKIKGKKVAIDYVYNDAKGKPFSEFTFMAPIYTYPYDYLFQTYAKDKYGYVPGNQKKGLVYLIIEPDISKPWTYKGWLETVIVGGKILDTVTLPTGHIIQKRLFPE